MKRGQGLSLTTIIIAAIAIIVLVVLIAIFTGRIGFFESAVSEEADSELAKMRINYGDCHPSGGHESQFRSAFAEADDATKKDALMNGFKKVIDDCKAKPDQQQCTTGTIQIVSVGFAPSISYTPSACSWQ
ncbi:hypothetical protein ACFLZB_01700 [Nanoarchaeota archaeon]